MKKQVVFLVIFSFFNISLMGCETLEPIIRDLPIDLPNPIKNYLWRIIKDPDIGRFVERAFGKVIGEYYDKDVTGRSKTAEEYNYNGYDEKLKIEISTIEPHEIPHGSTAEAKALYIVLTTDSTQGVNITEIRTLQNGNEIMELNRREVYRTQGRHQSTMRFTVPEDIPKGDYTLITTITDGKKTDSKNVPMKII